MKVTKPNQSTKRNASNRPSSGDSRAPEGLKGVNALFLWSELGLEQLPYSCSHRLGEIPGASLRMLAGLLG